MLHQIQAWDVVIMMAFLVTIGAGRLITAAIWKLDGQKISKSDLPFWVICLLNPSTFL